MADSLPDTPTDCDYKRGIEDYRRDSGERKDLPSKGIPLHKHLKMRSSSRSPSRRRSRSPIRKRSRSPRRDERRGSRGGQRTVRDKSCRVYVSNLNYDTRWMELKDVMKKIGTVEHVEVLTDGSGRSKGCAIVEYNNADDASRAIKELDGHELFGRKLRLREDNVDDETYREQLKTQKDKTKSLKDHQHWDHHQLSVSGSNPLGALGALGGLGALGAANGLGGLSGLSATISAQITQIQILTMLNSKGGDVLNSSVFVSNLDYEINWQKLKDMFRKAGNCIRCDIAEDDDRKSKGFGSVQFETPIEALTAVAMFNGIEMGSGRRSIIVRLDRNASLHQALAQLGINSKEVTQQTLFQIQSLATLATLSGGSGGLGAFGGLGGLGLQGFGALGNLGALQQQAFQQQHQQQQQQQQQTSAFSGLQASQTNTNTTGLNLSNLAGLGALGGLGNLLGATGGGVSGNPLSGSSSTGGVFSGLSTSSAYGQQSSTSSYGHSNDRRSSDTPARGYSSSHNTNNSSCQRVFVRNLPFSVNWQELKDKFRDAGHVVRADVKTGDDGRSKGYAVVAFETAAEANKAVSLFNGCRMQGREIEVRIDRS